MTQQFGKGFGVWATTLLGAALCFSSQAQAAKFANQFIEFELPPQWQCTLEGAEWVCQNTNEAKKKDAIIVLAAKLKGDQDSLDQYLTYLQAPKSFNSVQGKPVKSDPKYAKTINLNSQPWVDALHLESEIPGFYTRYLATIKQDIGVLVTYSINKTKYQQYLADFDNMVKTLKVFRKSGGINVAPQAGNLFQNTQIPTGVGSDSVFPGTQVQGGAPEQSTAAPTQSKNKLPLPLPVLVLLAIGAAVIFFLKRKPND
ncbi:MAG: hypothetical protein ABIQ95_00845 [Bdellovibrionia bacterium]